MISDVMINAGYRKKKKKSGQRGGQDGEQDRLNLQYSERRGQWEGYSPFSTDLGVTLSGRFSGLLGSSDD